MGVARFFPTEVFVRYPHPTEHWRRNSDINARISSNEISRRFDESEANLEVSESEAKARESETTKSDASEAKNSGEGIKVDVTVHTNCEFLWA